MKKKHTLIIKKKSSKFAQKLTIILVLSVLIPASIIGAILFMRFNAYIQEDVKSNNAFVLSDVQTRVQTQLDNVTNVIDLLSKVDYVQQMQPKLVRSMFTNAQKANPLIADLSVLDLNGTIQYSTLGETGTLSATYFEKAKAGEMNYSKISIHGSGTETRKVIKQAVPIYDMNGSINGVLIGEISLDVMVQLVSELLLPDDTDVLVISPDALLLAHSNPEALTKLNKEQFSDYTPYIEAQIGETKSTQAIFNDTNYLMTFSKLDHLEWIVVAQIPEKNAYAESTNVQFIFFTIIALAAIAGYIVSRLITKVITKPLDSVIHTAKQAENGDFTAEIDEVLLKRNDEFGDLGRAFSSMMVSFKSMIAHLSSSTAVLDQSSDDLDASSTSSTDVLNNIVTIADRLSETATSDISHAKEVVQSVVEMAEGSENVAKNTDNINMLIKNNVTFASTGVEMMHETTTLIDQAVSAYGQIEGNMTSLQKAALNIGGITDAIMNIASQTNLLALNAAIEAARAGDAGRGFAVVANEIRGLADQSNQSAGNITTLITDIQKDINQTSKLFTETAKLLNRVVEESDKTTKQMRDILTDSEKAALEIDEISAVTEEHAATSAHIEDKMNGMLESLLDTMKTSQEMSHLIDIQNQRNAETLEKIEQIKTVSEQFKSLIDQFKY